MSGSVAVPGPTRPGLFARGVRGAPAGLARDAVAGIDVEVAPGEWLAVTGPNGSGKTTLALILAGLLPVRGGIVELDGASVAAESVRRRIGVVLQEPATQLTQSTVREELAFTALNCGTPAAETAGAVGQWSERLGLAGRLERDPHALSAGEQQRLLIGAALAARPRLLIADEAGAHLDPAAKAGMLELVRAEARDGLAVVWVTQDRGEMEWADRVLEIGESEPPPSLAPEIGLGGARGSGSEGARLGLSLEPGPSGPRARVRAAGPLEITVERGLATGLTGPNGSGKTSLLECVAGLLDLDEVRVVWSDATAGSPLLVAQYPDRQIFMERVLDEITFAAIRRGVGRAQAERDARGLLATLRLDRGFEERRTWTLSAGEKRLVQLIGGLISPASALLLDEPTCGIDAARRSLLAHLVRHSATRTPALIASQDEGWLDWIGARKIALGGLPIGGAQHPEKTTSPGKKTD